MGLNQIDPKSLAEVLKKDVPVALQFINAAVVAAPTAMRLFYKIEKVENNHFT